MIVSPENTTPTMLGLLAIGKTPQDFYLERIFSSCELTGLT